ncbi:uncharacterized protein MELLADRAFT_59213 [Melampsora larici-populina 98AG31]|uniref:Uncharacterized protein n=1 Tax=Melampsora larici-populina (strain 98AG31 / pathotype 3-4-7) TaxID=747676 RepID=F4R5G7_MELLP|nr:uncharacterized protein MELLADRAFT_59213 [Melampsora larici-populina 98AG31]EGG12264.1 hypothetical protein MELLADRAFT_59213 [Melampsora larici-populina 98AG31]
MPKGPYIGNRYQRLPQHQVLPPPKHGGKVGLSCPDCSNNTSLVYVPGGEETVKVKCASIRNHYYRTFKLNQLNHEIACINAGAKYPIPFDPSAHGPRVNIAGVVLPPPPPKPSKTAKTPRAPPAIMCARPQEGATAAKHKPAGHAACSSRYCKSCCIAYGPPGACHAHRQKEPIMPPAQLRSNPAPRVPHQPPTAPPNPKRLRLIPAQCAQSVRRSGRTIPDESDKIIERATQAQAERKQLSPHVVVQDDARASSNAPFDEGKVVSLHLVTLEQRHPVLSHMFPQWPLATLQDCTSLLRKAKEAAGPKWDDTVLFWDEEIRNWHEIPVTLPHRYTHRHLVICIPSQRVALCTQLQEVLEDLHMGNQRSLKVHPT